MSQNCMDKYKSDFTAKFLEMMDKDAHKWKKIQNAIILELFNKFSLSIYAIYSFLGFSIPYIAKVENNTFQWALLWSGIFFLWAFITIIQDKNKDYQAAIKEKIFPELLSIFGNLTRKDGNVFRDIIYNSEDSNKNKKLSNIDNSEFNNSELYPIDIEVRTNDDIFYGQYNNVFLTMVETDFGWKTRILKFIKYNRMFKGLAMRFKMNKQIKSRVLILTKFSKTKIPKGYEKVELESVKFNKKYDIWVNTQSNKGQGQIEARYLLNTAFMERLMQIQTSFKVSRMCCSVFGDSMLIMLHTRKDLFEMNHLFGRIDDVHQYKHLFDEFASVLSFIDVLNLSSKTKL